MRTFAPFVAGVGRMNYARFLLFSVGGGIFWVTTLVTIGYFFGNLPIIRENLSLAIFTIIGISLLPLAGELVRARLRRA
jgi:membrane-associated protein